MIRCKHYGVLLLLSVAACTSPTEDNNAPDGGVTSSSGGALSGSQGGSTSRASGSMGTSSSVTVASSMGAGSSAQPTTPTVQRTSPLDLAMNVRRNGMITALFSEPMNAATITTNSFTLRTGTPAMVVPGTVFYGNRTAVFTPQENLAANTTYTATVTTAARSAADVALASDRVWTFETGDGLAATPVVNLGTAGNFVVLAQSAISTVPASVITGDVGISPAAATFITGFSLIADATDEFATSTQVTGRVYASDYAPPTPTNMTTAVADMGLAFTDAAGRPADVTELGAGNIGGMTLSPGVYSWGTGLLIPSDVTLTGTATDVWIFQVAQTLTVSNGTNITLAGGALPKNVFWQVTGAVSLGTTSHFEGVILSQTAITLGTGASINGRLLAQTAVSLDTSTVVAPAP